MASRPEPPQTLVLGTFAGVKNTVSEERLTQTDLVAAVNVDIDDAGQLRRRRGQRQVSTAVCHSLKTLGDTTLLVKDGVLGRLYPNYSFVEIVPVGPDPVTYVRVGDDIYWSNRTSSGIIARDGVNRPWGDRSNSVWVSPVVRPTETLGQISGKYLGAPPQATIIELYKGRIYLGHERLIWTTELYLYSLVDKTKNFIQLTDDLTMLAAVSDGLYVGTTAELLFLQGTFSQGMKLTSVVKHPVVHGSLVEVPYSKAMPQARSGPVPEGHGPMFMTDGGICIGMDGGQVYNLTQDRVVFPGAVRAAALYREDQGANGYVAVVDSAGGPSANARIGDYVDAEIVRASQRG